MIDFDKLEFDRQRLVAAQESINADQGGFRVGLAPQECSELIQGYLELIESVKTLQAKFDRAVSCR